MAYKISAGCIWYTLNMCRLAIYIGPQLSLENLLLKPEYGLMEQSWGPKEMNEGKLNADGYGFAWFNNGNQPASYRNPMPIWTDINLESLARTLTANQWFANVRSATVGLDVSHANTQPFTNEKFIYLHNGYIKDFKINYRAKIRSLIDDDFDKQISGTTDSEYIFALICQAANKNPGVAIPDIFRIVFDQLGKVLKRSSVLLNLVIGDGEKIFASRHAINGDCPSLYYNVQDELYPGGQLIVSEPFHESTNWRQVPEHHIITLDGINDASLVKI